MYICLSGLFTAYQRTNFRFVFVSQRLNIFIDEIAYLNIWESSWMFFSHNISLLTREGDTYEQHYTNIILQYCSSTKTAIVNDLSVYFI